MGCTPSTPLNSDSGGSNRLNAATTADSEAGVSDFESSTVQTSTVDKYSQSSHVVRQHGCVIEQQSEGDSFLCGLLDCCGQCRRTSSTTTTKTKIEKPPKQISASLTGLHSLGPESTGSECATQCDPYSLRHSPHTGSCSSLCSICDKPPPPLQSPSKLDDNNNTANTTTTTGSNSSHNLLLIATSAHQPAAAAAAVCANCSAKLSKRNRKSRPDSSGSSYRPTPPPPPQQQLPPQQYCCRKHQHRYYRHNMSQQQQRQKSITSICTAPTSASTACYYSSSKPPPLSTSMSFEKRKSTNSGLMISNTPVQLHDNLTFESLSPHSPGKFIKFGRMNIELKSTKILMVFRKLDPHANSLRVAAERASFSVYFSDSAESAMNMFVELQPEIVIIDARNSAKPKQRQQSSSTTATSIASGKGRVNTTSPDYEPTFEPSELCRSIRNIKGSEFTCILAFVKRNLLEKEEFGSLTYLKSGFNRCLAESCHSNLYVNELVQLRDYELIMKQRLRAASTLFTALDMCKDGVVITGPRHDIQFANNSIEKAFGFRLEEIIGKKTQDYFQTDLIKSEVDEKINNYNEGKEWEGQIYHRRKSGESVPIWNQIVPINYHKGVPEYIVYVKEFHFNIIDKMMSPDTDFSHSYGSLKGLRKTSFDVKSDARRPSLAKFNSISLIEGPITKVINILMAIKENGPPFVRPPLEKAIDALKNSEVFMPQLQSCKPDDQLTTELVRSLIDTNKTITRRMSHEAVSNKSSISNVPNTPTYSQPSLTNAPLSIQSLLENDLNWGFDVIELERITSKRPLVWLGLSILNRFNICQTLRCNESTLRNWLTVIESNYHDNPYHNSTHAADVMQATACFLMSNRLKTLFDPLDQAICLLAAIIHDIDHPGRNSAFLSNSNHDLAILYNDISVLESHHAAYGFKLTIGPNNDNVNIFKNLDNEVYREVRQSMIDMVLATEMTKHFEHLTKFVHVLQEASESEALMEFDPVADADQPVIQQAGTSESPRDNSISTMANLSSPDNIVLIKRMLIKCADVSNPGRPLKLCEVWAKRIASEYCDQTEEEKKNGLPLVMPTFDSKNCSIPKSQIGFIDYFAYDLFDAWHSFGDFPEMIANMNTNYSHWKEQQQLFEKKKLSLESNKLHESDEDMIG